jgi:hypothetical protein
MPNKIRIGTEVGGARKSASEIDQLRDRIDRLQNTSKKGLLTGFAAGAAVGGIGLATSALNSLTSAAGEWVEAAEKDVESANRLKASLQANVPAWDGNTDAIERAIKSRMKLAFADDEQRDSIARLVVATGNEADAVDASRTAMDLARLKSISLGEATDALTRIEGGQFRALKSLGIQLPKNATVTQALAAVEKAAAGQAEAYAKAHGKLVAEVERDEAFERLGGYLLPLVTDATEASATAATGLTAALDLLEKGVGKTADAQQEQFAAGEGLLRMLGTAVPVFTVFADQAQAGLDASTSLSQGVTDSTNRIVGDLDRMGSGAEEVFGTLEDASGDWRDAYQDDAAAIGRSSKKVTDQLIKDAARIRGDVFDETEVRASLHDQRLELFALEEQKRSAKTAEARRQASDDIAQALDDEGQHLEDLAALGKLTSKDVDRFADDVKDNYDSLSKEGRKDVDALLARYRLLASQPNITKTFTLKTKETRSGTLGHAPGRGATEFGASGGRFPPGTDLVVGEKGWERMKVLPGGGVEVMDHNRSVASMSGGGARVASGGGPTFNITIHAGVGSGLTAGAARQFVAEFGPALYADMQRKNLLPRTGTGLTG